jgi:hypothetical protein
MESPSSIVRPIPDEEVEVVLVQPRPSEFPGSMDLFERRLEKDVTERDDVDPGESSARGEVLVKRGRDDVPRQVLRERQYDALPAAHGLKIVV